MGQSTSTVGSSTLVSKAISTLLVKARPWLCQDREDEIGRFLNVVCRHEKEDPGPAPVLRKEGDNQDFLNFALSLFLSSLTMWISLRQQAGVKATLGCRGKAPFSMYFSLHLFYFY